MQKCLVHGATSSGVVKLHLGCLVTEFDFEATRFHVTKRNSGSSTDGVSTETEDGWIKADVILAADGVKSKARGAMLARKGETDEGEQSHPEPCDFRCLTLQWSTLVRRLTEFSFTDQ